MTVHNGITTQHEDLSSDSAPAEKPGVLASL